MASSGRPGTCTGRDPSNGVFKKERFGQEWLASERPLLARTADLLGGVGREQLFNRGEQFRQALGSIYEQSLNR